GWALFFFASLAVLDFWPEGTGGRAGGRFGHVLVQGANHLLGRLGTALALPLLGLAGLFMAVSPLRRAAQALLNQLARAGDDEPEPAAPQTTGPGLEADPLAPSPAPRIVEKVIVKPEPVLVPALPRQAGKAAERPALPREPGGPYQLPGTGFLDRAPAARAGHASGLTREELTANARLLESKLSDFGVEGRVLEVSGGPVITMYEYQPAPGVKISKVAGLSDDLTMAMRAISIRVVAPLPGKAAIGIEIPNPDRSTVSFREVVESEVFQKSTSVLSLVLGVDIMGAPVVADLAKMPHLLIAGATGSGKSVGLGSMIMSILFKARPDQVRFLMIDPKCVELALYKDIPHLIYPVLSDPSEATLGLKWAVAEMDLRYKLLAEKGVRNIETYNAKVREELKTRKKPARSHEAAGEPEPPKELPFLVIIIDELADLMMVSAKEVEVYITRLAQKARAAGIHLILATQRPSVDVLTGIIKANMPTRISFQVSSRIDSRTILDQMGAEKLLGRGDMLFLPPGVGKLRRLHGAFVSDDEIKAVTDFIRDWGPPDYIDDIATPEAGGEGSEGERDEKYDEAVELVRRTQKATISHVQRHLRIGYNRAARIIEDMEREGIIGPQDGTRPRVIF
ncbi:MAG: DNA translocase FtsK, partial [Candidatus Adiutrix sp.]|nr:DNA translocase FtsK [Candidatus Adiutrix sp.]